MVRLFPITAPGLNPATISMDILIISLFIYVHIRKSYFSECVSKSPWDPALTCIHLLLAHVFFIDYALPVNINYVLDRTQ